MMPTNKRFLFSTAKISCADSSGLEAAISVCSGFVRSGSHNVSTGNDVGAPGVPGFMVKYPGFLEPAFRN